MNDNNLSVPSSSKSCNMRKGRASRRRKQKMSEICQAERQELLRAMTTAQPSSSHPVVLPSDRSRVRQPVLETRHRYGWVVRDEDALVQQLGFVPGNAIRVCCRCGDLPDALQSHLPESSSTKRKDDVVNDDGNDNVSTSSDPVVVQLYPLAIRDAFAGGKADGRKFKSRKRKISQTPASEETDNDKDAVLEPFPTMYWLTHPLLKIWVSKLEVQGVGSALEERLAADGDALERMRRAHAAYGRSRRHLLTPCDDAEIRRRRWSAALEEARGVAGIRNHAAVKCLHAHLAHHLCGESGSEDNVVGQWVVEAICRMQRGEQE